MASRTLLRSELSWVMAGFSDSGARRVIRLNDNGARADFGRVYGWPGRPGRRPGVERPPAGLDQPVQSLIFLPENVCDISTFCPSILPDMRILPV